MIALVTGASGFLGAHLCRHLIDQGFAVRAMHREHSNTTLLHGVAATRVVADLLNPPSLSAAMRDVDLVFHVAAIADHWRANYQQLKQTMINGTRHVLESARDAKVKRVVYTSSLAALGLPAFGELLTETHLFNETEQRWGYGYAKHCAEQEVQRAVQAGLDCVIVNPAAIFGAGDLHQVGGALIVEVAKGRVPAVTPGGMNILHIADAAQGHVAAALKGQTGERYILGGENVWHRDLVKWIAQEVGTRPPQFMASTTMLNQLAQVVDAFSFLRLPFNGSLLRQSAHTFFCDAAKAQQALKLPAPRAARQAVHEAVQWYREQKII